MLFWENVSRWHRIHRINHPFKATKLRFFGNQKEESIRRKNGRYFVTIEKENFLELAKLFQYEINDIR